MALKLREVQLVGRATYTQLIIKDMPGDEMENEEKDASVCTDKLTPNCPEETSTLMENLTDTMQHFKFIVH